MRFFPSLLACAAALLVIPPAQAQQPTADYSTVVDANTRFALKVIRVRSSQLKQNEIVSPIALSVGFALLRNGANSQCADKIAGTFEFRRMPNDNTNKAYAELLKELLSQKTDAVSTSSSNKHTGQGSALPPPNGLYLANSFWDLRGHSFSMGFEEVNKMYYGAEMAHLDYGGKAVSAINSWAKEQSYGTVDRVVSSVAKDDFLFTSLLYFRARWRHEFLTKDTHADDFTLFSGAKKSVQMMKQSGQFLYEHDPGFEAIALPYGDERTLYVFLPDKVSSLKEFEASLTEENWNKWTEAMSSQPGTIELPKFRLDADVAVQPLLTELGAGCVFDSLEAVNKAVPVDGARLTHAEQSLSFATDEQGSEAVAYTGIGGIVGGVTGGMRGYQPPPPFHMVVNRPFFAAIVDEHTRTIVLVSSVVEP
jgi:serine protease inhibitor